MDIIFVLLGLAASIGIPLGFGVNRRLQRPRLVNALLWALFLTLMSFMALGLGSAFGANLRAQLIYPQYTATIIDYESEWQDQDDGGDILMHSAILQFTENNGQQITRQSSTSSSLRPVIGDTVTVYYNQGKLYEPSFILYGALGLFIFVTGYIVTYATFFAFGWQRQGLETIGIWAVFYGFIPAGLLLMSVSMLWAASNFAFGANRADLSGATAVAIGLLGGLIFAAFVGYAKLMIKGRKTRMSEIK